MILCGGCNQPVTWGDHGDGNAILINRREWHLVCVVALVEGLTVKSAPRLITNWEPNPRGFMRAEFKDLYGEACSIQQSGFKIEPAIWLGLDQTGYRMHLNQALAGELWQVLKRFAETGELGQ